MFQIKFDKKLKAIVHVVVESNLQGDALIQTIENWSRDNIERSDREKFTRLVEQELASLHIGNIAIYHINPICFDEWKKGVVSDNL